MGKKKDGPKGGGSAVATPASSAPAAETRREIREKICNTCFRPGDLVCGKCKQVWYCSADCQKKDWNLGHKGDCGLQHLISLDLPALPPEYQTATVKHQPVISDESWSRLVQPDTRVERPVGFLNLGNTCYLSAALQCLASMPSFSMCLEEHAKNCSLRCDESEAPSSSAWGSSAHLGPMKCFRCDLRSAFSNSREVLADSQASDPPESLRYLDWVTLHDLSATKYNGCEAQVQVKPEEEGLEARVGVRLAGGSDSISVKVRNLRPCAAPRGPREVVRWLPKLNDSFNFGDQEDSHEFCRSVLRMLEDEQMQEHRKNGHPRLTGALATAEEQTALPSRAFGGLLVTQRQCTEKGCGGSNHAFESFQDLALQISDETDSIEEMLQLFTAPERLDKNNMLRCDQCGKEVRARRRLSIYKAPQCLVLQLKRFQAGFFGKINKRIDFKSNLNLRPFLAAGSIDERPEYDLRGVLVHLDRRNISHYGHYISFVKTLQPSGQWQWYKLDDESRTPVPEATVLRENAYLLFYSRVDAPGLVRSTSAQSSSPTDSPDSPTEEAGRCASKSGCTFFAFAGQELCSKCYRELHGCAPPEAEVASKPTVGPAAAQVPAPAPPPAPAKPRQPSPPAGTEDKKKGKIGANERCPCGSGSKYKKCHGK